MLKSIHHIAIICSDYETSKAFYVDKLGLEIISETYRKDRNSHKLDLALNGRYCLELFSFPNPPERISYPEATGLRHLAFTVTDLDQAISQFLQNGITPEPIRIDPETGKRFTFLSDPDGLPLELYEETALPLKK
ncbi:VOC family protein [Bacillus sp. CLL-7-23]|uniref:VOC family protein n=1 Tax=Bacillus changyiensis TaxID=3004103 RepID=A0ABT4WZA6_9BACI|nr:VOC family protein [Bacillus changyiensis]MDA7025378.1 VOC family protein [Bacillus changyiensis]